MNAREYDHEGRLTRFSLDRRITVLVLLMTALVVGAVATSRMPVELIPSGFEDPFLRVRVPWSNAPAEEVLDKVVLVLEEELSTVRGFSRVVTVASTGSGAAYLWFKQGTDMDVAYREVRDRVERAKSRFPSDIDRVFVNKHDPAGIPVTVVGVAIDPSVSDAYNLVQNEIVLPLSRIDGVASVAVNGLEEKEILIELDRDKTAAAGLNIFDLSQQLGSDNFTMASGTVRDGPRKLLLRSMAQFDTVEELEQLKVAPSVRLRDIATVTYAEPEKQYRARAMSKPAVAVIVFKEGQANIRQVSQAVAAAVDRFETNPRLSSLEWVTLFNQGEVIDEALSTLLGSGAIGGVIAAMTLFFFMRRVRLTVIIAACIPLSLLIGLTTMYFGGETLNLITLLGLMICVGLLVDNSVVVAENIHRLHAEGLGRRQACVRGAGEVGLAITMSTLTTLVVFLPVALVEGPGQFFLFRLAFPVCVSVTASLIIALVFIPLCVYLTLPATGNRRRQGWVHASHQRINGVLRSAYEHSFGRLNGGYNGMLGFFLRRRFDLVLVLMLVGASMSIPAGTVKFVDSQEEERSGFFIEVEMPASSTLEETEQWFLAAEKVVESKKDELGLDGWFLSHDKTDGQIQGWFARPRTTDISPLEATRIVKEALPRKPGIEYWTGGGDEGSEAEGESVFQVVLWGEDHRELKRVTDELSATLAKVDGVLGRSGRNDTAPNEMGLVINRERAQLYDVNPQVVAGVVSYALRGSPLPKYHTDGKEIPVRVRFREQDRESLAALADFLVPTNNGTFLPISTLADARFLPAPERIARRDKRSGRYLTLELEEGTEDETRERLSALVASVDLPEGVTLGANQSADQLNEDLDEMKFAALLSVVFIYLLMGFLFESFILPLSIILTIPLSAVGVWWVHFFTGRDIDFLGVVAIVLLIGVVVNNGIVLVDYVNRLRESGRSRRDAVLEATHRRFRPIMMTAITTIGGMVPLAFAGANSIGLSYTSFALTLIGGMTTATLMTLLVVPVFYTFFDDARLALGRLVRTVSGWFAGRVKAMDAPTG